MAMYGPAHPGELLRRDIAAARRTVTECAQRHGVARNTLSRLLNERIGASAQMALALERLGWSNAEHWMRLQTAYDLAQARRREAA